MHDQKGLVKPQVQIGKRGVQYRGLDSLAGPNADSGVGVVPYYSGAAVIGNEEIYPTMTCGEYMGNNYWFCEHAMTPEATGMVIQKVEPKLLFANERTFIKWLKMAVLMSSIAAGILAFTSVESSAQYYAMTLLPISFLFIVYASNTFMWRMEKIRVRDPFR